ncbi:hypothetical protein T4C_7807 [Trichinella pseudospiralis]|uniref:Uncharacterized protein n=1 Tax=Trichinella pseudospiralis TaxID=6337 RepID=A0A0V1GJM4_TRIPS|nr:hypothetical protein T4C_7807 [Trichinella pseudospiralis]
MTNRVLTECQLYNLECHSLDKYRIVLNQILHHSLIY